MADANPHNESDSTAEFTENVFDPKDLVELLHLSHLLHQEKISDEVWLAQLARLCDCESTACVRWLAGKPEQIISSTYGDFEGLAKSAITWLDHTIKASESSEPWLIGENSSDNFKIGTIHDRIDSDPNTVIAILDWQPARILMIFKRSVNSPAWSKHECQELKKILIYLRESINVHKQLDRHRYIARLAKDILDSSPRGMIVLSSDGVIQMANSKAEQILTASDGISRKADKLVIDDREGKNVLHEHLSLNMNSYPPGETDAAIEWNLAIKRPSGASDYQIILGTIKLQEWHIESRGSDRIAIVYIHDPENKSGPTLEQLKSFYGFTDAQARLAATLYSGHSMTEAADSLNISINTARSHIRNIYQKIGVSTQAELLGLLASGLKTYGTRRN